LYESAGRFAGAALSPRTAGDTAALARRTQHRANDHDWPLRLHAVLVKRRRKGAEVTLAVVGRYVGM
jgi:hypothetical protein